MTRMTAMPALTNSEQSRRVINPEQKAVSNELIQLLPCRCKACQLVNSFRCASETLQRMNARGGSIITKSELISFYVYSTFIINRVKTNGNRFCCVVILFLFLNLFLLPCRNNHKHVNPFIQIKWRSLIYLSSVVSETPFCTRRQDTHTLVTPRLSVPQFSIPQNNVPIIAVPKI